jgi:hypothetical protein
VHARNRQYLILEFVNIIMYYLDTGFRILILLAIVSVDYCSSFFVWGRLCFLCFSTILGSGKCLDLPLGWLGEVGSDGSGLQMWRKKIINWLLRSTGIERDKKL